MLLKIQLHKSLKMENFSWCLTRSFTPTRLSLHGSGRCFALYWREEKNDDQYCTATDPATYNSDLPTRNTGTNIMEVTDQSLIRLKVHSMKWNPYLAVLKWPRSWEQINHRPRRKPTISILLKDHSNETTPNGISLYPRRSFSDEGFFLQEALINMNK